MSNKDYLPTLLDTQTVRSESDEMAALRAVRGDIEKLLLAHFAGCTPKIRYGGSKAKGTMNRIDYDLDVICYFPRTDTPAGKTIAEIYDNVKSALERAYIVQPKTTALRIRDQKRDLHIDVVPGRFIDGSETYAFVHQYRNVEKGWLQTNLDKHIDTVRDSGCVPEIRLAKIWRHCSGLSHLRTFPLELLVIKALKGSRAEGLEERFRCLLTEFRDNISNLAIVDPANDGNDLSEALSREMRVSMSLAAGATLRSEEQGGWGAVFGKVMAAAKEESKGVVYSAAVLSAPSQTPPWAKA